VTANILPADADVRERALDPGTSFIVQAPAGSGKTELLTRRYLRLLAVVERPEEILAITFTRKAAAEMRSRILKALQLGAEPDPPEEAHRLAAWELARAARAADARHGWRLESHPARLKVQTIDALNHTLARQLPVLSGTGSALQIANDSDALYAEAIIRVVEALGKNDATAAAVERLVRHLDNRLEVFTSLLTDLLARRDHWLDLNLLHGDRTVLRDRLEGAIEAAVTERLQRLRILWPRDLSAQFVGLISSAAERLSVAAPDHPLVVCRGIRHMPGAALNDLPAWRGIASVLLVKTSASWRKTVDKNAGFPSEPSPLKLEKQAFLEALAELTAIDRAGGGVLVRLLDEVRILPAARYSEGQWAALDALLEVLMIATAELEVVFRERGEADHVAAALAGRAALGSVDEPTDLALKLDYRLRHLLVDEFQDTSRSQIRLLRLLTAGWSPGDGRSLFVVGDPMQSIYRFREADVGLFLQLQHQGIGDLALTPLTLSVNFRSNQPVIDFVNATFDVVLPAADDPERGAVRFTGSEARPGVPLEGAVRIHALVGPAEETRPEEASTVAEIIRAVRARRPVARIAVLVASRSHLLDILPALEASGIAYQAVEIDPLRDRTIVRDLLALTRALVHLGDRTAWLAILRAPWCGLLLADLHALVGEEAGSSRHRVPPAVWSLLNEESVMARLSPDGRQRSLRVRTIIAAALDERGRQPLRDWVERAWHALGGPAMITQAAELADAEAFLARLDRLERAGDLEDVARIEDEISDLYAVPARSVVQTELVPPIDIMTLHKAKGLEFDTVILPALERTAGRDEDRLLRWIEVQGPQESHLLVAPLAAKENDADPLHEWLKSIEQERARFERGRQLYVGATRAITELHLIGAARPTVKQGTVVIRRPPGDSFLGLLWPLVEPMFVPRSSGVQSVATSSPTRLDAGLRRVPADWSMSLEGLPDFSQGALQVIAGAEQPEFDWVSETGRHVGTLVHREIERIAQRGVAGSTDESALDRYRRELAELGVPAQHRAQAAERVASALANLLDDERGRWILAGTDVHREVSSELELSGYLGGALVNGVIDRTFVDPEGTRWIVDFKTSLHGGSGLEDFLDSEAERYRQQLQRYAGLMRAYRPGEPVKAALYFPLLKAWKEVDVSAGD
jgi:ATP-dependent exoDNAse (exonuclease V) beta subunit